ncbi:C6 zinc finger domain protein [Aspergillus sclerotioniger CBS 115572]|uniref:C6 zinc finger domain protein n=1 Tax=Aspergillus sclerotioniger CBS 115572 TaxID=1450535 RepID=A0A317XDL3_9EURO|nr:C6 zinc finger domain protein [Aspergillus sclerotioniger CBS 115572]PWY96644.1 C6 zinc finger domain protein [Aspergillus sclerotioniger CBS 115572]
MKRKVNSHLLDSSRFPKRTPRQDPVSCESCRLKKIKCDRQQPCSSCLARQLDCIYGRPAIARAPQPRPPAVVERGMHPNLDSPVVTTDRSSRPHASPSAPYNRESLRTADWLENIHLAERVSTATPKWLRDGLGDPARRRSSSVNLEAGPKPLLSMPYMSRSAIDENPASVNLVSFLPTKAEALGLFRYYHHYVDYLYHILIPKRVEGLMNGIYHCIDNGSPVELNHLALLFSILASSLCLQMALEAPGDAEARSQEFVYLTGAALIQSHYTASPTLEGLQATMVVMHNVSNWKIPSLVNGLFVHGAIVSQAKSLMLHCVDSPSFRNERDGSTYDAVELELKRRLWWDLASYDWLMGFLTGPQEWTYLIHPEHMNVNKPTNIDDDAIGTHGVVTLPSSTPTDMSFFLQRLKLAFVSRDVVDATSYEHLHGLEISYDKILELDRKFHEALAEIPEFFRLDAASRRRFASVYEERPTIAWQCCLLQQGFYSRLCRLHRDFFIRGAREPAYSYSHVICLQSARKVLEIKRIMDGNEPNHTPPNSVVWSVMHHVFAAAVILLLDVCFNWDDILAEKRKEEVLDACRMLSKAQESSSLVREGINGMMSVLQKHWKHSLVPRGENPSNSAIEAAPSLQGTSQAFLADSTAALNDDAPELPAATFDSIGGKQLEDIWSEMLNTGNDLTLEAADWTELLNELTDPDLPRG